MIIASECTLRITRITIDRSPRPPPQPQAIITVVGITSHRTLKLRLIGHSLATAALRVSIFTTDPPPPQGVGRSFISDDGDG